MVGLPLIKLGFLAIRQVTRPLAKRVVERAKTGTSRRVCIVLGRVSLGISGSIMELATQEEIKAKQEKASKEASAGKLIPAPSMASGRKEADVTGAARVAAPRSRSLLQGVSYGPLPRERYDPSVFVDPGRSAGEAVRIFIQYPYKSTWDIFRKRFLAPYPEDKLVDAGAELLLEFTAFFILAMVLSYELYLQFKATARKEAMLYARIDALERRVAVLETRHDLQLDEGPHFNPYAFEEIVRYPRTKSAIRSLVELLTPSWVWESSGEEAQQPGATAAAATVSGCVVGNAVGDAVTNFISEEEKRRAAQHGLFRKQTNMVQLTFHIIRCLQRLNYNDTNCNSSRCILGRPTSSSPPSWSRMRRALRFLASRVGPGAAASSKRKPETVVAAPSAPPQEASRRVLPSVPELDQTAPATVRFTELVSSFRAATEYLSDLEDPMETPEGEKASAIIPQAAPDQPVTLSCRTFSAAITCPKKFFLMQYRPDLLPRETIGEAVHYDDAAAFGELARRWDRLQFGSKALLAQKQTEKIILDYFAANASLAEQGPTLTLHRPAFAGPCMIPADAGEGGRRPLVLRARPLVVRYRPKDNQWVIILSQAVVDPMSTAAKAAQSLQQIHFAMRAFRNWVTQPHIPITLRKRFLTVNMDPGGNHHSDSDGDAPLVAPIDVKRSGVLHIRQYFPGPVSVLDCDPPKLVKYIQRLPLEDLLHEDCRAIARGGGLFDLSHLAGPIHPLIARRYKEVVASASVAFPAGKVRSSRSLKKRDSSEKDFFEHQQELMSALLAHYVPALVHRCEDPARRKRWTTFSNSDAPEPPAAPAAPTKGKGKKALPPPCYSEHLGPHCSKGKGGCPFFVEDPVAVKDNHLFTMPSSAVTKKVGWWASGMRSVGDVLKANGTDSVKLSPAQMRYAQAVVEGKIAMNPAAIRGFFDSIRYPLFILDFEATSYAVPPHRKVVAYQSVPFQFSLDVFQTDVLTETPVHYDFLHFGKGYSPSQDPRRACINELMRIVKVEREKKRLALLDAPPAPEPVEESAPRRGRGRPAKPKPKEASAGPLTPYDGCFLAHYAAFEKSCLEKLGMLEEMYREDISGFYFLDTLELFKKGIVHPNAHGSNSLKKILPALCPDFQYGVFGAETGGAVQDEQQGENAMGLHRMWQHHEGGDSIRQLFARSSTAMRLPPALEAKERERVWATLRIQLLEYCSMDTKGIYEILRELAGFSSIPSDARFVTNARVGSPITNIDRNEILALHASLQLSCF
eukprot:gene4865-3486_t